MNKAAIRDKDKALLAAVGTASPFGANVGGLMMAMQLDAFVRIGVGAERVRFGSIKVDGSVPISPIVQMQIQFDHAIPELDGKDVIKWLWLLYDRIHFVFGRLEPHLTP